MDMLCKFLRYSAPVLINETLWGTGFSMITVIMGHMANSSDLIAAYTLAGNIDKLMTSGVFGIAAAVSVIVGKEIGTGNLKGVYNIGRALCFTAFAFGIVLGLAEYTMFVTLMRPLMRTTVVVRGGEWLASAPIHYELFHVLGFKMPKYAHTAHLMKFDEETGGKRKLSKRKDPELSLDYYRKDGYHPYTMKVYLMTLLNSNFEEWHEKFPDKDINEFPFSLDKMSTSGALFDKDKLHNICKNELSKLSEDELYDFLYDWAEENEPEKKNIWFADKEKMLGILRLYMGIGMKRRRKDFMYAKQIFEMIGYFFDMEDTQEKDEFRMNMEDVKTILNEYLSMYNHEDDNSEWFNKLKAIADKHGYASGKPRRGGFANGVLNSY